MVKLQILLRFDDICPTMNWDMWGKAKDLLDEYGVKALLGVIPDCQDEDLKIFPPRADFWEYIKGLQNQGYTIAMHGYQHVFDIRAKGIISPKKHSEFAGHPYVVQSERIKKGKDILLSHGINTDVFFAPAHSYDDNTLKALAANGFKYISDGKSRKPYNRNGITCIPSRSGGIPIIKGGGGYTVILHAHEWVREDKRRAMIKFQNIVETHKDDIQIFEDYIKQSKGNNIIQEIDEWLYTFGEFHIRPLFSKVKNIFR